MRYFIPLLFLAVTACDSLGDSKLDVPLSTEKERQSERGKLTGDDGWSLFGGDSKPDGAVLGVNSFLWRATLDTLSFMPLASADPFGGVILTDWYEDPKAAGERFKVTAMILDRALRADAVKVTVFKQTNSGGAWRDSDVNPALARKLEDTILTRAREMRVNQAAAEE